MIFLLGCAEPSLTIGHGLAGDFIPYADGEVVTLATAPQGGFGVPVRAQTTALYCGDEDQPNAPIAVLLDTWIEDDLSASFLNDTAVIYCQDDGTGLVWDLVVGFDQDEYRTVESLISLHGQLVDLHVEATDTDGVSAGAWLQVEISAE